MEYMFYVNEVILLLLIEYFLYGYLFSKCTNVGYVYKLSIMFLYPIIFICIAIKEFFDGK